MMQRRERKKVRSCSFKKGYNRLGGVHLWEMRFQQKSLRETEILFKMGDVY
jgi:hypothetical protein